VIDMWRGLKWKRESKEEGDLSVEGTTLEGRRQGSLESLKGVIKFGIEARGILPVPIDQRVDPQYSKIFFVFLSANFNILSFSQGTLGPVIFGLGLRDSALVILFFNLLCCALPAYLATWGPKLGLRQMCHARYSFGYFGVIIPSILNLATFMGYLILNCILGGSTLASISNGRLSWTVGIVIIAVLSLFISFCGYKIVNVYERYAWLPVLLVYLSLLGEGGSRLKDAPLPAVPATAGTILSFASVIAGFVISYVGLMMDFTAYFTPKVSSTKIFVYSYLGFIVSIVPLQIMGAAFAAAAPAIPEWNEAYANGDVGNLIRVIVSQGSANYGAFLTVLLALSVTANTSPTIYSFCLSFQVFVPWFARLPRYVFSVIAFAIMTPLAIVGAHRFYDTLVNFTGIIGYWSSAFSAVVIVEQIIFRHNDFGEYDLVVWNSPKSLPPGIAAIGACVLAFGLVIPSMDQVWFVGPFAERIGGDIGFEVAFAATALLYLPLRFIERRVFRR